MGYNYRGPGGQSIKFYCQLLAKITEDLVHNQRNLTVNYWLKLRRAWWAINKILPAIID